MLGKNEVGRDVEVAGWVNQRCNMGGLIFTDLLDHSKIVEVVCDHSCNRRPPSEGEH